MAKISGFHHDFFVLADGGGTHDNTDCLGNAALFANHAAHVAFCHREVVHNRAVLTRGVNRYLHRVLIFHKATATAISSSCMWRSSV